ncbi:MAG: glycosyltransferase [Lachnospiraceae bacterium]|nr:glycosyltransferase [Lachnospiraceae bacterium]
MPLKQKIRQYREEPLNQKYRKQRLNQRSYDRWLEEMNRMPGKAKSEALSSDLVLLTKGEGELSKTAAARINAYMAEHEETLLLYGDEDENVFGKEYGNPWLKPDWSPDTFLDHDYLGAVLVAHREFYEQVAERKKVPGQSDAEAGISEPSGLKSVKESDEEPSRLTLLTAAGGFAPGCQTIAHLPYILFHRKEDWKPLSKEHKPVAIPDLSGHMVSIIIPSKDHYEILSRCLDSLTPTIREIPYEILVVDNGSTPQTKEKIKAKLSEIAGGGADAQTSTRAIQQTNARTASQAAAQPAPNLRGVYYLYEQKTFNFSNMCNTGAANAQGDLLLFLNDDTEAMREGWLETMAAKALSDWAGAVGAKLFYPGGDQIQHAGITNIRVGPVHKLQYLSDSGEYYDDRNHGVRNMLAVTGACLLVRADRFKEVGGFEESLRVAFNDVDFCYKLYERGYHNISCNEVTLYHHESLSRGKEESQEDQHRLMRERNLLIARHPALQEKDPYYNPGLNWRLPDTAVRPPEEEGVELEDVRQPKVFFLPSGVREDPCLKCTFELVTASRMQGWIAVLGSNNACFESAVLLKSVAEPEKIYKIDFTKQYRADLERNMPDQENVALCGFAFRLEQKLPAGEYRLGAYSKDKLSRLKLVNWKTATVII